VNDARKPVTAADLKAQAYLIYAYLNQGTHWKPKVRPIVRVADMGTPWRRSAARWMERRAGWFEFMYGVGETCAMSEPSMRMAFGEVDGQVVESGPRFSHLDLMSDWAHDAFDAELDARSADPVAWLRKTPLYRAMVDGIPEDLLQGDAPEWTL
jgi:hypothetical protein